MSLIVVPVGAGEGIASVRHLARILSSTPPGSRPPLVIAPEQCGGWADLSASAAAAGISLAIGDAADVGRRVEAALSTVQLDRLPRDGRSFGSGGDSLLIVPVLHSVRREDLQSVLDELEKVIVSIDAALKRGFRSTASIGFPNVAFVPWAFLSDSQSILIANALFKGPESIAGGLAKPLVRFAERRGMRSEWEGYGETQLAIDLLALSAIAAEGGDVAAPLRRQVSDRPQFVVSHAAIVELPWTTCARIGVLRSLVGGDNPPLVAEPAAAESMASAPPAAPDGSAANQDDWIANSLRTLLDTKAISDADFRTGDSWVGVPVSMIPLRREFVETSLARRSDEVHNHLMTRLESQAAEMVSRKGGEAVLAAQKTLDEIEKWLEQRLQNDLTAAGDGAPIAGRAIAGATAFARSIQNLVDVANRSSSETLEGIVDDARHQRGVWRANEDSLWQRGSRVPQQWAVIAATAAVAFALLLAAAIVFRAIGWLRNWSGWIVNVCTVVSAGGLTALFYISNENRVRRYFEQWRAFEDSIRSSLQGLCGRLATLCNQRVTTMKVASVPGLLRRLTSAVNRLRTEVAGMTSICREQLAADERAQSAATGAPDAGRFYYAGELVDPDPGRIERELRAVLRGAATLKEAPQWVPIETYREKIDAHVAEVVAQRGKNDGAKAVLEGAAAYANAEEFTPVFNDADVSDLGGALMTFCGTGVHQDIDDRQARRADVLPPELAVFFSLRSYEMAGLPAEAV